MTSEDKRNKSELVEQAKRYKVKQWWLRSIEDVENMVAAAIVEEKNAEVIPQEAYAPEAEQSVDEQVEELETASKEIAPVEDIAEVVVEPVVRRVAPKMPLSRMGEDSRTKTLAKLDAESGSPTNHLFQRADMSDEALADKGMERTGQMLKNDIIVRTDAERFALNRASDNSYHRKMMGAIDTEGDKILSLTETPKRGRT